MKDSGKRAVIDKLKEYDKQFKALLDLIGDKKLQGAEKAQAQHMLRALKDSLEADCKDLHRRRDTLNEYERHSLQPALMEARAHLTTKVNTIPDAKWFDRLYESRMDITYVLGHME